MFSVTEKECFGASARDHKTHPSVGSTDGASSSRNQTTGSLDKHALVWSGRGDGPQGEGKKSRCWKELITAGPSGSGLRRGCEEKSKSKHCV